jgi:hypothetical protein
MYYCGLDVSLRETALCIVDADGKISKEAKVPSDPDVIARTIIDSGYSCQKVGLESGCMGRPTARQTDHRSHPNPSPAGDIRRGGFD